MKGARLIGAGAFVVIGLLLFTLGLFMIGERRMLFEKRFPLYTEFSRLGQLEVGSVVRVAGADAGEVTDIRVPSGPAQKFRVQMQVRKELHPLIRTDSVATTQTEGLVGAIFVNIQTGTDQAPPVAEGGVIAGKEPFSMADLMQQMSDTVTTVNATVQTLSGDMEKTVQQIALTAEDARGLMATVRPDLEMMARNGARISGDAQQVLAGIQQGKGTIGKLVNDDALYRQLRSIADQAQVVVANVRDVSSEARGALADFRSKNGPAQGLLTDMRTTLSQAREATGDLADNMEALKHNFLLRGFFNRRGYFDLGALSPMEYRTGVLENGQRKALRIWLRSDVLFAAAADGTELLTPEGRSRVDSAMATYLKYLPGAALIVEGYAAGGTTDDRFVKSSRRAGLVRDYVRQRYALPAQDTASIALGDDAKGNPGQGDQWDGIALTLFVERQKLQFGEGPAVRGERGR